MPSSSARSHDKGNKNNNINNDNLSTHAFNLVASPTKQQQQQQRHDGTTGDDRRTTTLSLHNQYGGHHHDTHLNSNASVVSASYNTENNNNNNNTQTSLNLITQSIPNRNITTAAITEGIEETNNNNNNNAKNNDEKNIFVPPPHRIIRRVIRNLREVLASGKDTNNNKDSKKTNPREQSLQSAAAAAFKSSYDISNQQQKMYATDQHNNNNNNNRALTPSGGGAAEETATNDKVGVQNIAGGLNGVVSASGGSIPEKHSGRHHHRSIFAHAKTLMCSVNFLVSTASIATSFRSSSPVSGGGLNQQQRNNQFENNNNNTTCCHQIDSIEKFLCQSKRLSTSTIAKRIVEKKIQDRTNKNSFKKTDNTQNKDDDDTMPNNDNINNSSNNNNNNNNQNELFSVVLSSVASTFTISEMQVLIDEFSREMLSRSAFRNIFKIPRRLGGSFLPVKKLGQGAFGSVYLCIFQTDEEQDAREKHKEQRREEEAAPSSRDRTSTAPPQISTFAHQQQTTAAATTSRSNNNTNTETTNTTANDDHHHQGNNDNNTNKAATTAATISKPAKRSPSFQTIITDKTKKRPSTHKILDELPPPTFSSPGGDYSSISTTTELVTIDGKQFPRERIFVCKVETLSNKLVRQQRALRRQALTTMGAPLSGMSTARMPDGLIYDRNRTRRRQVSNKIRYGSQSSGSRSSSSATRSLTSAGGGRSRRRSKLQSDGGGTQTHSGGPRDNNNHNSNNIHHHNNTKTDSSGADDLSSSSDDEDVAAGSEYGRYVTPHQHRAEYAEYRSNMNRAVHDIFAEEVQEDEQLKLKKNFDRGGNNQVAVVNVLSTDDDPVDQHQQVQNDKNDNNNSKRQLNAATTITPRIAHLAGQAKISRMRHETHLTANLAHPNIVSYIDSYRKKNKQFLFLEYVDGGDLDKEITKRRNQKQYLSESSVLFFFVQLLLAVEYLHRNNVLHRDLKPANCLLTRHYILKVSDFGTSEQFDADTNEEVSTAGKGTPLFLAPEIYRKEAYSEKADMWSLGVILFNLADVFNYPYYASDVKTLRQHILHSQPNRMTREVSRELGAVISCLLSKDPSKRPTALQLLHTTIMQEALAGYVKRFTKLSTDAAKKPSHADRNWLAVLQDHVNIIREAGVYNLMVTRSMSRSCDGADDDESGDTSEDESGSSGSAGAKKKIFYNRRKNKKKRVAVAVVGGADTSGGTLLTSQRSRRSVSAARRQHRAAKSQITSGDEEEE